MACPRNQPRPFLGSTLQSGALYFHCTETCEFEDRHLGLASILASLVSYVHFQKTRRRPIRTRLSEALGVSMREVRGELGLTQEQVAQRLSTSRIAISRWESGAQPPSIGPLRRWCQALGLLAPQEPMVVTAVDISRHLLPVLQGDPSRLAHLTPSEFECFVAERVEQMGFDVQLTGKTTLRDGGIDIVAIPKLPGLAAYIMAVQVKHHVSGRKTGRVAVDRLLSWKDSPFRIGLLVTNTGFTRDALWAATLEQNQSFLRLRGFEDLKRWLQGNFWDPQEIPDSIDLAPGLTIKIPRARLAAWGSIWPLRKLE